jgi:hypothetical protein
MPKMSECAKRKVIRVMKEFAAGTLKSSSGEKVTERDQALAIALSEARATCGKSSVKHKE